jgi:hypothetical protein
MWLVSQQALTPGKAWQNPFQVGNALRAFPGLGGMRLFVLQPWIERVAQAVAEEIEREERHANCRGRKYE